MRRLLASLLCATALVTPGVAAAAPKEKLFTTVEHTPLCATTSIRSGDETILTTIASLVIGSVVEKGIKGLGSALQKAGAPEEVHVVDSTTSTFYAGSIGESFSAKRQAPCIAVITSVPNGDGPARTHPEAATWVGANGLTRLEKAGLDNLPNLYLEMRIVFSNDLTAWRLVPVQAWVGKPLTSGNNPFRGKGRDLAVTISTLGPSATDGGDVLGTRTINFARVDNEKAIPKARLAALATDWMPLPPLSETVRTRAAAAVQRDADIKALDETIANAKTAKARAAATKRQTKLKEAQADDVEYLAAVTPVAFRVDVHETRDGNKVAEAVGKFLAENSEKIAEPIVKEIDPVKRAEAAAAASTKADTLRIAAITAVEEWQTAEGTAATSAGQKRIKKIQAQAACRALQAEDLDDPACAALDA